MQARPQPCRIVPLIMEEADLLRSSGNLVLGVRPGFDDLAHSPLCGLSCPGSFGFVFLRLLGFAIPMLLAVCHDPLLRYPETVSKDLTAQQYHNWNSAACKGTRLYLRSAIGANRWWEMICPRMTSRTIDSLPMLHPFGAKPAQQWRVGDTTA
jgi:hypothetical protein